MNLMILSNLHVAKWQKHNVQHHIYLTNYTTISLRIYDALNDSKIIKHEDNMIT